MLISKKTVVLYILASALVATLCSAIAYSLTIQSMQAKYPSLKGTYQLDIKNTSNIEYLAVMESLESDASEGEGEFQWYKASREMMKQGTCEINKEDFVTLYVDNVIVGMIVNTNGKYYFIDDSLKYQEVLKVSNVPMVISTD